MYSFYPDEAERIEFARLVLVGVQPSEIEGLDDQERWDILSIANAHAALKAGKLPGE